MILNMNTGKFYYKHGSFSPDKGTLTEVGRIRELNPAHDYGKKTYGAAIIIGLTDRAGVERLPKDLINAVRDIRLDQIGDPGASFMFQRGLFKHRSTGTIVEEDSVRVLILNLDSEQEPTAKFRQNILAMGEKLREDFDQEEIIVEFQDGGVQDGVYGIKED